VITVTGGAALLPDLDHPSATAARSLGIVTRLIAKGVDAASLAIYHASREGGDPAERHSGHRLFTHTLPGALLASLAAASLCLLHPAAGAVLCALLAGLMSLGLKTAGGVLGIGSGAVAWWLLDRENAWWWLVPVSVFVGCVVHILGDTVTNSGTPLLWPLRSQGRRWRLVTTPVTFAAGDAVEHLFIAPLLMVGVVLASGGVLGVWPVVWAAVTNGGA
jgi:membrane-bound metal-dependent hydrolase YbcI (DUF457 family)